MRVFYDRDAGLHLIKGKKAAAVARGPEGM